MKLILLINGSPEKILKLAGRNARVVKIDEKDLARAGEMRRIIAANKPDYLIFGCKELELQRFRFFMKFYIMIYAARQGMILDEYGERDTFRLPGFVFYDLPKLAVEIIASVIVLVYYHIKIPILRKIRKKKGL
jgi:hypothetical protein